MENTDLLFRYLDAAGYSQEIMNIRRKRYTYFGKFYGRIIDANVLFAGSKGEGITKLFEGDDDILHFLPKSICLNDPEHIAMVPDSFNVYKVLNIHPGYCSLEELKVGMPHVKFIRESLIEIDGKRMVSSALFKTAITRPSDATVVTTSGPAKTMTKACMYNIDVVYTLKIVCQGIIETWVNRSRPYKWPSSKLRRLVLTTTANLVATGKDGSETEHIEWRYCFNEIEQLLVKSLNPTQTKLYIVLKMINNDILKMKGFPLTSFFMKNIVFWLAESNPRDSFQPDSLFKWVLEGLKMLQNVVDQNELKYYMIPERNLFIERVAEEDRERLKTILADLINEGPGLILQCKSISKLTALTPEELKILQSKMEELELSCLQRLGGHILHKVHDNYPHFNAELFDELDEYICQLLDSGWPDNIQQAIRDCGDRKQALHMLLS